MTDETHLAGDDLAKRLRDVGLTCASKAADRIEQLEADADMMFAKGMSHGQQVLKDTGRLVIVDSPELVELREALTRANAATAAAFEVAADVDVLYVDEDGNRTTRKLRFLERNCIHALATPDQSAALDRLIAEAEARVWDKAAQIAKRHDLHDKDEASYTGRQIAKDILAASKKGGA